MAQSAQDPRYQSLLHILRQARLTAGLTQAELARRLGMRQQFVSKYESGERRLDVIELTDIAQELKLDLTDVLRRVV